MQSSNVETGMQDRCRLFETCHATAKCVSRCVAVRFAMFLASRSSRGNTLETERKFTASNYLVYKWLIK